MWDNIGNKLQRLAKVICWLGIIGFAIFAIILWTQNSSYRPTILLGILYLVLGCLGSWIGSWVLYGLGLVVEYVENGGTVNAQSGSSGAGIKTENHSEALSGKDYWVCDKCKNRNPVNKIQCRNCGAIRY